MLTHREEKLLKGLAQRRIREAEGCFLAEGVRLVEDLLASAIPARLLVYSSSLEDSARGRMLLEAAERLRVRAQPVSDAELARLADTQTPQGVIAVAETPRSRLGDLAVERDPSVILVLDAVQDPGNFGTLVRTAEALGAVGVVALPGTVDAWNPKSVRAAMGSSLRLPIVGTLWDDAAPWMRANGFRILAGAADGEALGERPSRAALVVGNEGSGVSVETRAHADQVVAIPLRGRAESLNVAAAAAILLYNLLL